MPSWTTSKPWGRRQASTSPELLDDLQEDALARALLGRLDGGVHVRLRHRRGPLGHLVHGVRARPVEDVGPARLLDVGQTVVVHREDAGLELHADAVAGAE